MSSFFQVMFFDDSKDSVEEHCDHTQNNNGHKNPGKLEAVGTHCDRMQRFGACLKKYTIKCLAGLCFGEEVRKWKKKQ